MRRLLSLHSKHDCDCYTFGFTAVFLHCPSEWTQKRFLQLKAFFMLPHPLQLHLPTSNPHPLHHPTTINQKTSEAFSSPTKMPKNKSSTTCNRGWSAGTTRLVGCLVASILPTSRDRARVTQGMVRGLYPKLYTWLRKWYHSDFGQYRAGVI